MKNKLPPPNQPLAPNQRRHHGQTIEQAVRRYLESEGLDFIQANYQCRMGELDLIMSDSSALIFVEVRYRNNLHFCNPLETVTPKKQRKLIRTASHYLIKKYNSHDIACRFDVVGVSQQNQELVFNWIRNAFY